MKTHLPKPELNFAFRAEITLGPIQEIGVVQGLRKRVIPITGGTFVGPAISGQVLPGGADWQTVTADGTAFVFARYTLQTDCGDLISVINEGIRRGPPEVLQALATGQTVDPDAYYFRTSPRFETGSQKLTWLMENIFACRAARYPDHVLLECYRLE